MTTLPDATSRLHTVGREPSNLTTIADGLQNDDVMMVANCTQQEADRIILEVAELFGLREQLELQATFASLHGHRSNIAQHFMTVNKRREYEFIPAHSEGISAIGMQLAAFYCHANTTDGGYTILLNVDSDSPAWRDLREIRVKADLQGRTLSPTEASAARMRHQVSLPQDIVTPDDVVVNERPSYIADVRFFDVLGATRTTRSRILGRDVNVYWDSVASTDHNAAVEYRDLLSELGILRLPPSGMDVAQLDNAHERRLWRSGVSYGELFKGMICRKLAPGELIIQNNLTWAHSASNWTPGSGVRNVAAAFA